MTLKRYRKIISLFLVIAMLQPFLPVKARAEVVKSGTCGENLTWTLTEDGMLTLSGTGSMTDYSMSNNYPTNPWFTHSFYYPVKSIVIHAGVTDIGDYAFYKSSKLVSVEIPDTVTSIGTYAFGSCDSLVTLEIPDSITSIANHAFSGSKSLESLVIPDSVTAIGEDAFSHCTSLTNIKLPANITAISKQMFRECNSLTSIDLPDSITRIDVHAFAYCTSLTNLDIPDNVTSIGNLAFINCSNLKSISIPASVTSIGDYAFSSCNALADVYYSGTEAQWETLKDNIGTYNEPLFAATIHYNSSGEEEPEPMPDLPGIGGSCGENLTWSFDETTGTLTISGTGDMTDFAYGEAPWFDLHNDIKTVVIGEGVTGVGSYAFYTSSGLFTFSQASFPSSLTRLGEYAFGNCNNLTDLSLPGGVQIGNWAFSNCDGLEKLTIGSGSTVIGEDAFVACTSLKEVTVGSGLTTIGSEAFGMCTSLAALTIPNTITAIGEKAFVSCTSLSDVYYSGTQEEWVILKANTGEKNDPLFSAILHCNWMAEENTVTEVRYYFDWEPTEKTVYFGASGNQRALVTDQTDPDFTADPEALQGSYVLADLLQNGEQEVLIRIKAVESKTGTVTSVDITDGSAVFGIDGSRYSAPESITNPDTYAGQFVLYHLLDGSLVSIEILEEKIAFLRNYVNGIASMDLNNGRDTHIIFRLSPLADADTDAFLCGVTEDLFPIYYTADSAGLLFGAQERDVYTATEDGWCFSNSKFGFMYPNLYTDSYGNLVWDDSYAIPEERYEEVFGASYVATANAANIRTYNSMMGLWGGSCNGMSLTSVLFYLRLLDWNDYKTETHDTVNHYHTGVNQLDFKSWAYSSQYSDITKMIERYQILWNGTTDAYSKVDSTFHDLEGNYWTAKDTDGNRDHIPNGNYIQTLLDIISASGDPLMVDMEGYNEDTDSFAGHAVVIRTDRPVNNIGGGWYRVYVYDPNIPFIDTEAIDTGFSLYDFHLNLFPEDSFIELNPAKNIWRYCGSTTSGKASLYLGSDALGNVEFSTSAENMGGNNYPDYMYIYSIRDVGMPLRFNGTESWIPKWKNITKIVYTDDTNITVSASDGTDICRIVSGIPVGMVEGVEYHPYAGITTDGDGSSSGSITIPYTKFVIDYENGTDLTVLSSEAAVNVASTGELALSVSSGTGSIELTAGESADVTLQITDLYSSSEYSSITAVGNLQAGDAVELSLTEDAFVGSLKGYGALEILTDNEQVPKSEHVVYLDGSDESITVEDIRGELPEEHLHVFGQVQFEWADDFSSCTLHAVCADCGHCRITGCSLSSETVASTPTEPGSITYTAVAVLDGLEYSERKTVVIPALGYVIRLSGKNRYDTAFAVANQLKKNLGITQFGSVVVAYGQNFPDALTGSYLAAVKNAPILLTEKSADARVLAYIEENLVPGGTVYILGGTAAVTQEFEDGAKELGFTVKRLKDKNRYGTNLKILEEAGVNQTDEILIATGTNYADSLSASATGLPMLLVGGSLTDDQIAFLKNTSGKFVIMGGTGAVSQKVEDQLNEIGTATRVKGKTRYETSVVIAERYFGSPKAAVLAYAQGFPDGLCGGPLAMNMGAPLILTSNESPAAADAYIEGITVGAVTGGTGRITDDTVRAIFDLAEDVQIPVN